MKIKLKSLLAALFFIVIVPNYSFAHGTHYSPISDSHNSQMISNTAFRAKDTMSLTGIQNFLVSKGSALASYSITFDTMIGPGDTVNANGMNAATIIYNSAQWYGINPQVLLATLNKESSLVTSGTLTHLNYAMGYACPESSGCDPSFANFARQMDGAAYQFDYNYRHSESKNTSIVGQYYVGNTTAIDGKSTYIGNSATASFFRYTPHRPDSAYLTATNGSHYYGNYNFISFYNSWFPQVSLTPVYRFYKTDGTHFYTASESEKNNIMARWGYLYKFEGVSYNLTDGANTIPLYRFYNTNGTHFYTASAAERDNINRRWGNIYKYEGVAYSVSGSGTPVYRFYNTNGTHFYTASAAERDNIIRRWGYIYKYEGVAYYIQ